MTHLEAERRYQFATQKLINLKWWLRELEFQAPANSPLRMELHNQAGIAQKAIDNLLSDDFVYDVTAIDTMLPHSERVILATDAEIRAAVRGPSNA